MSKPNPCQVAIFLPLLMLLFPINSGAETGVYGKLMLGLENIDDENEPADYWEATSYASRFGVKGGMPTDVDTLEVVYKLEWEVDVTDEKDSADNHFKARNQYLGLSGGFGKLLIGRHDTPFKDALDDVDLFNDIVDIKRMMAGGENRADNMVQYTTPTMGGLSATFMGVTGEDPAAGRDGPADAASMSVNYHRGGFYAALALDSDIEGENTDGSRVVGSWFTDTFGVGGLVQSSDYGTGTDEEVVFASGYYSVNKTTFKLQAGSTTDYGGVAGRDADSIVAGVDYALADRTTLGAYIAGEDGGDVGAGFNRDTVGFLLIHQF